jgi:hypothetical protein
MRFISTSIVVGSLLFAGAAWGAEGKGDKGGPAPSGGSGSPGGGGASQGGEATRTTGEGGEGDVGGNNPDTVDPFARAYKPWEVGVAFTTHRLVVQNDLAGGSGADGAGSGAGADKMVNDYEAYVRYDITKHDRLSLRMYMYERFLADPGENGVRLDDMVLTYTHSIPLPRKFNLDIGLLLTAPTSYDSYLAGTVTTPRLTVGVDRRFGPLSLDARTYFQYDIQTEESYGDGGGGAPTSLAHVGIVADAELHMPFYEPLSVGVGIATGYTWYHEIAGQQPAATDSQFGNSQPIQQSYGGEAYLRYLMPSLAGFKPDVTLAYAMGDATIGYSNILHDGVGHLYLGYRENSEFYLRLAVAY